MVKTNNQPCVLLDVILFDFSVLCSPPVGVGVIVWMVMSLSYVCMTILQCFDAVGWAAGRASGL